jgi:uncharacterized protein (TIGR03546 family)
MVGAEGSRIARLLRRTSKHHRPSRLAAAMAIGIFAGMLPKANLLGIALYAVLLLLPIHTLLGLVISGVVSCAAGYFDFVTHEFGSSLLNQRTLRPLWLMLENAPLAPWLELHNTVVLGNFVIGFMLLGPSYMLSLRAFERVMWGTTRFRRHIVASSDSFANDTTFIVEIEPSSESGENADGYQIVVEPVDAPEAAINDWHMVNPVGTTRPSQFAGAQTRELPRLMVSSPPAAPTSLDKLQLAGIADQCAPPQSAVPETHGSLELAQSASEVLAWVDQLLDECLADEGLSVTSEAYAGGSPGVGSNEHKPHSEIIGASPSASRQLTAVDHDRDSGIPSQEGHEEERWLMETTIEIVRWADQSIAEGRSSTGIRDAENGGAMPTQESSTDATPSSLEQSPAISMAPQPLAQVLAQHSSPTLTVVAHPESADDRPAAAFQHLVIANALSAVAAPISNSVENQSVEPHRGECLGYLLGHLRQTRDGRSS